MLGAALALIVLGILLGLLVIPWVGFPAAVIGVILLVVYLVGAGRRPARR